MKKGILIAFAALIVSSLLPAHVCAKRSDCKSGEELVFSIPEVKPEWIDRPHSRLGANEFFVGLSTQNAKLEDGISLAVENANGNVVEALGQVIKKQSQGVLTLDEDDVRQSFGSAGAATYLQHKERKEIYYEKWASYDKCKPKYHYNVWVQISVPTAEFKAETLRAERYLRELQREEELKAKTALMPTPDAMQAKLQKRQRAADVYQDAALGIAAPAPAPTYKPPYEFSCNSFGIYGGYTYMPSVQSEMGKQESGVFNVNADIEFNVARNFCMGFGMGWAMTKMAGDTNGSIVPFFLRFALKAPFDHNGNFIGWIGAETGVALLHNFNKHEWKNEQKATAAFMVGPAAGFDIRLRQSIYLTVGASYTPIFYKNTIHLIETRVGLRFYF